MYNPKFTHKSIRTQATNLIELAKLVDDPLHPSQQNVKTSQSSKSKNKVQDRSSKEEEG